MILANKAKATERQRDDKEFNNVVLSSDILHDSNENDINYPEAAF